MSSEDMEYYRDTVMIDYMRDNMTVFGTTESPPDADTIRLALNKESDQFKTWMSDPILEYYKDFSSIEGQFSFVDFVSSQNLTKNMIAFDSINSPLDLEKMQYILHHENLAIVKLVKNAILKHCSKIIDSFTLKTVDFHEQITFEEYTSSYEICKNLIAIDKMNSPLDVEKMQVCLKDQNDKIVKTVRKIIWEHYSKIHKDVLSFQS